METPASQPEISDDTRLSSREMYRLSQRIVVDWDGLAGFLDIARAERDDIRFNCFLYNESRSRAEKILSIFNQREDFSRKKLAACLEKIQLLELVEPVTTGEWRNDCKCKIFFYKLINSVLAQYKLCKTSGFYLRHKFLIV